MDNLHALQVPDQGQAILTADHVPAIGANGQALAAQDAEIAQQLAAASIE